MKKALKDFITTSAEKTKKSHVLMSTVTVLFLGFVGFIIALGHRSALFNREDIVANLVLLVLFTFVSLYFVFVAIVHFADYIIKKSQTKE